MRQQSGAAGVSSAGTASAKKIAINRTAQIVRDTGIIVAMKRIALAFAVFVVCAPGALADASWREKVVEYANAHLDHPAWGVAHARRDLQLTLQLAKSANVTVDEDAIFAAAYLHDIGAIDGYSKPGVEHMARALELIDPILEEAGFPMARAPLVHKIVGNHMFFSDPAGLPPEALYFRDADTLDFLGAIGIARIFALTGKHRWAPDVAGAEATVRKNYAELPAKLATPQGRAAAVSRVEEMKRFLDALATENVQSP